MHYNFINYSLNHLFVFTNLVIHTGILLRFKTIAVHNFFLNTEETMRDIFKMLMNDLINKYILINYHFSSFENKIVDDRFFNYWKNFTCLNFEC